MATKTWQYHGATLQGYNDPADWTGGVPPGPGDTAVLAAQGSNAAIANLSGDNPSSPGGDIEGQVIDLFGGTPGAQLDLNDSVLGAGTTINTTGAAYFSLLNSNTLAGTINVGAGAASTLQLTLKAMTDPASGNTVLGSSNTGAINVSSGSELNIFLPLLPEYATFTNNGTITVANGGNLLDSGSELAYSVYDNDFVNNGVLNIGPLDG